MTPAYWSLPLWTAVPSGISCGVPARPILAFKDRYSSPRSVLYSSPRVAILDPASRRPIYRNLFRIDAPPPPPLSLAPGYSWCDGYSTYGGDSPNGGDYGYGGSAYNGLSIQ